MQSIKISSDYQIVIPKQIRESFKLVPGQKIKIIPFDDRIELIPEKKPVEMRGFLKGINTDFTRETERL